MVYEQQTFSGIAYSGRSSITKGEEFLDNTHVSTPWEEWTALIQPHCFDGKRGRKAIGIEKTPRMYLLRVWFNLSDEVWKPPSATIMPLSV